MRFIYVLIKIDCLANNIAQYILNIWELEYMELVYSLTCIPCNNLVEIPNSRGEFFFLFLLQKYSDF